MDEEKYGYENIDETEILEFDTSSIAPVAPPVAMAPEVHTEAPTEVLTEVEVATEPVTEVVTEPVTEVVETLSDGVDGTVQLNEVEIKPVDNQVSNIKLFFTFILMIVLGGTIIFMPEISNYIRLKQDEEASLLQQKITTGSLKCEIERKVIKC